MSTVQACQYRKSACSCIMFELAEFVTVDSGVQAPRYLYTFLEQSLVDADWGRDNFSTTRVKVLHEI